MMFIQDMLRSYITLMCVCVCVCVWSVKVDSFHKVVKVNHKGSSRPSWFIGSVRNARIMIWTLQS